MTYAKVILDSWNGHTRLTTMEIRFHRFILPEFNTHRVFSRNAASSRAIPVKKQIEAIKNDPAWPVYWGKAQSGMSAHDELTGVALEDTKYEWRLAMYNALTAATYMDINGLHKQLTTRVIEPFMWCTMIVSATEWDNFFTLRCPPECEVDPRFPAQPEMQYLASKMKKALDYSKPERIVPGDWHIPFLKDEEKDFDLYIKLRVSAARCARISYLNHEGVMDTKKDLELAKRLIEDKHMSPLEHQAQDRANSRDYANFKGWLQFRHSEVIYDAQNNR